MNTGKPVDKLICRKRTRLRKYSTTLACEATLLSQMVLGAAVTQTYGTQTALAVASLG